MTAAFWTKAPSMVDTVLLTGAGGFIGKAVLEKLGASRVRVKALDLGPPPPSLPANVEWIEGNIADQAVLERAMSNVDQVIHLAFIMDLDGDQALACAETNLLGTVRLFDFALRQKVRRVTWASSVMVYGPRTQYPAGPVSESAEPMPRTPYGASKLALEWMARSYRRKGLETVGLRFTTVFGPGRTRLGAAGFCVSLFEQAVGGEIRIEETDRRANMLYIDDAANACLQSLHAHGPLGDVYNIGGFECSAGDLVHTIQNCTAVPRVVATPGGSSPWPTEISVEQARKDFGYTPAYDIDRACLAYLQYLQANLTLKM